MTSQQNEHIDRLVREFSVAAYQAYKASCEEYGMEGDGNLWSLRSEALTDHLMNEVLRLWVYAAVLRERIKQTAASQSSK